MDYSGQIDDIYGFEDYMGSNHDLDEPSLDHIPVDTTESQPPKVNKSDGDSTNTFAFIISIIASILIVIVVIALVILICKGKKSLLPGTLHTYITNHDSF